MKNFLTALLIIAAIALAYTAQARIVAIQDWDGSRNSRVSDSESEVARCLKACSGYSSNVTYCPPSGGKVLESCPEPGCKSFKRCAYPEE